MADEKKDGKKEKESLEERLFEENGDSEEESSDEREDSKNGKEEIEEDREEENAEDREEEIEEGFSFSQSIEPVRHRVKKISKARGLEQVSPEENEGQEETATEVSSEISPDKDYLEQNSKRGEGDTEREDETFQIRYDNSRESEGSGNGGNVIYGTPENQERRTAEMAYSGIAPRSGNGKNQNPYVDASVQNFEHTMLGRGSELERRSGGFGDFGIVHGREGKKDESGFGDFGIIKRKDDKKGNNGDGNKYEGISYN